MKKTCFSSLACWAIYRRIVLGSGIISQEVLFGSSRECQEGFLIVEISSLRIMATTIEQQTALDESLVPSSQRLRIGRSNFRLPSDIQSKEATLQVVYDVLRNSPLFRAFQVTVDVPEIYMQEFWATAKLHHHYIRFKIDTRKSVLDLEAFREMLHISPRIPNQQFADLPTEEEVLDFLRQKLWS
nr:hypothetical protein [Tanacetum cinerariifolium]